MFKISKYISVPVFIISLAIGLFVVYLSASDNRIVYVYPTPENQDLMLYRDKASQCFTFEHKEVQCPKNPANIAKIPVQG
tara:strand:+ start:1014 stop:1253 length:240 start_codon:yes stop_codon:yes gene_type:complete